MANSYAAEYGGSNGGKQRAPLHYNVFGGAVGDPIDRPGRRIHLGARFVF